MPRKRKLSNLADRCRFCLARDACMSELFADWLRPKLEDLQKLAGLQLSDKVNYPRKICYVCLYKLEMWNEFKKQFLKTNKTLITHFKIVEETVPEVNKSLDNNQDTADELLSDDNKKRPKIDSTNVIAESEIPQSPLKAPEKVESTKIDDESAELEIEENLFSSVDKSQVSDNSASNNRKGRSKKIVREASTKRWEERKNALIAATGEVPSESESDNGSQLSPVQKARVKARNIEMEFERQKKIQKALKNLQTDLTEKYKVSYQDIVVTNERKTRSRQDSAGNNERKLRSQPELKPNIEEICITDNVKVNLLKSPLAEKKLEMLNIVKKEIGKEENKVEKEKEEVKMRKKKEGKRVEMIQLEDETVIDITDEVNNQTNETQVVDNKSDKESAVEKESVNKPEKVSITEECKELPEEPKQLQKSENVVANKKPEIDIDVIDLEDIEDTINTSISQNQEIETLFNPQELKSEVTLGNATYVVTTILDLPGSSPEANGDISLKSNGLNVDATSQDGNKIDVMNAVQLQKVQAKVDVKEENKTGQDVHQCLKIEIEGMEAQALQRVQLDLAHFVTEEIQQILTEGEPAKNKTNKPNKHKDSYETLNHQLKAIVHKVLRSNFETDKLAASTSLNFRKLSPDFLQAATHSPVFQPQVVVERLNLGKLCKIYNINNLHILEEAKRRRGVVGPLSRTLGKRRLTLPKRYEDFALSVKDEIKLREEENRLKNASKTSATTTMTNSSSTSKPMTTIPATAVTNSTTTSTNKTVVATKTSMAANRSTPLANKLTPVTNKAPTVVNKPIANATSKPTTVPANKATLTMVKSSTPVNKPNVTVTTVSSNETLGPASIAKIRSEVPPTQKPTVPDASRTIDSIVMEWSDSDQSVNDAPIMQELSTSPFKNLQLPKIVSKVKDLSALGKKSDAVSSSVMITTKPKSSMSVTKTTVPKTSAPSIAVAQSTVQIITNTSTTVTKTAQNQQKANKPITTSVSTPVSQKYRHLCGICNKELFSEKEAEAHVKSHKVLSNQLIVSPEAAVPKVAAPKVAAPKAAAPKAATPKAATPKAVASKATPAIPAPSKPAAGSQGPLGTPATSKPPQQEQTPKPKLMRCKRCQAIVEAEQVKTHVCNSVKFNCSICDCRFGAKHLLDTHMESTHPKQSSVSPAKQAKGSPAKDKKRVILVQENKDSKNTQLEKNVKDTTTDKDAARTEGYSCFVCDKMFDDEIQMKEHLYMHSDEVSDDGDDKGFPCAFCYEKFQTEESLEAHVDNHLKDDGDEKINMLLNLNTSRRERKRAMFRCEICTESFNSAMLLAMHMQNHEEEEAELQAQDEAETEAAAEQQNAEPDPYVCTICDQMFETTDELSEHLDMHNGNAHVCILCEKPFSSIEELQIHVSTHL